MKIVHICLAAFYVEGWGYQENILPKYHVAMGHDVTVLTSDYVFNSKSEASTRKETEYTNPHGVKVRVVKRCPKKGKLYNILHDYVGLYELLVEEKPDLIFVHGGQFVSLSKVVKYVKKHSGTRLCVDQHADYYNTKVSTFKSKMAHRYLYGTSMRKAARLGARFYGVTPWRCEFLRDIYRIPQKNISLLVMGGDDEFICFDKLGAIRTEVRRSLDIQEEDFVVVAGGKIDKTKNFHLLMQAVAAIQDSKVKLILFGQPTDDMEAEITTLAKTKNIRFIGWQPSDAVYKYFLASDLACFPGTHSVLWEQACACGLPGVFKEWHGMQHVDVGGNAVFLKQDSADEIKTVITHISENADVYNGMRKIALETGAKSFSYKEIARSSISF